MFQNSRLTKVNDKDFPFFFADDKPCLDGLYKVYNDGGHFVATPVYQLQSKVKSGRKGKQAIDYLFDSLYKNAIEKNLKKHKLYEYLKDGILKLFPDFEEVDKFISEKIERKKKNLYQRIKRFKRKAYLNRWNYFITFTYDDKKHDETTFRKKLRRCLSNLKTRRNWRYMGVFERAPETGRLHFHALCYIPDGQMVGSVSEVKDYDKKHGIMQTTFCNDFFMQNFGRNDFKELNEMEVTHGNTIEYLLKYIGKSNERIIYSRGIATEVCLNLTESEIATTMFDYVQKFILFDKIIQWDIHIMNFKPRQMSMFDMFCNYPQVAV
ncbi:MAG: hypothetical protein IJF75_07090 [Clostridia bacterium]|nr:hypothetical protein [Clostridia bacterium]